MQKIITSKIISIQACVLALFFASFSVTSAQSLNLSAPRATYEAGTSFLVTVSLNTEGRSINTVSGTVDIPTDKVQFVDLRYGNSIISLWVEKPSYNASQGVITFTGGVPGGYSGSNGPILSFTVRAKTAASPIFSITEAKLLLNDGMGTEIPAKKGSLTISVIPAAEKPKSAPEPNEPAPEPEKAKDETAPEPFLPVIAEDPSIAGGDLFVSFNAVDKDTGVLYYEVEERPWIVSSFTSFANTGWVKAEPPYVLERQWWPGVVAVRAVDGAGNAREALVRTPFQSGFTLTLLLFALLIGGAFMYWLKPTAKSRRKLV